MDNDELYTTICTTMSATASDELQDEINEELTIEDPLSVEVAIAMLNDNMVES